LLHEIVPAARRIAILTGRPPLGLTIPESAQQSADEVFE
jgi:hypothetical protein